MQIMETLIPITIVIGDRNYRIKIQPKDEEVVRKTVKTINDQIIEFKTNFAGKDMQDYVAMALISYATEQTEIKMNTVENENLAVELSQLEKILDNHLTNSTQ
jgi:cell division protein ZapA (FtsZ GTPase activity inhibitor)